MFRLSLRRKLTFFAIAIAIIPLVVAGRTMIRIAQDELKSSANEQLSSTARQLTGEINDLYEHTWLAPLLLIRNAIDSDELGVQEKVMFNLVTTPVYGGASHEIGYWSFLERMGEIFGLPAALFITLGILFALLRLSLGRARRLEADGLLMLTSVLGLYYLYFGSFPRLETRFVLPVAPYALMMVGPLCAALRLRYLAPPLAAVVAYNVLCSAYVGWRFTHDPRMAARAWINEHVPEGSTVEYTPHAPRPDRFIKRFEAVPMARVSGRAILFRETLGDNPWVADSLARFEPSEDTSWYTKSALSARAPDYVWIDSLEYDRFFSAIEAEYYPEVRRYYEDLLGEDLGYARVFDAVNPEVPWWVYPRQIDFLENRMTILQREAAPHGSQPTDE